MKSLNFDNAIEYIKSFLTSHNDDLTQRIKYMTIEELNTYKNDNCIIIIKSNFFDTGIYGEFFSLPDKCFDFKNTKAIFGNSGYYYMGSNIVYCADLIASTYFLLSRYEEFIRNDCRDSYGNFPARESFLYKNDLLLRPIIDEYGEIILGDFSEMDLKNYQFKYGMNSIVFTHDIDVPFNRYSRFSFVIKDMGKSLIKDHILDISPFLNWIGIYKYNPRETWNYMLNKEKMVKSVLKDKVECICFLVAIDEADQYTMNYIDDRKMKKYIDQMKNNGSEIGLHTSFNGATSEKFIRKEKKKLESKLGHEIYKQRNHYLRQINPSDIIWYANSGILDDYTTGYNEMPGFRLGTTRICKYINPSDGIVYSINIHSLNIMDGSLDGKRPYQLDLSFEEAQNLCKDIIDTVCRYNGDLCLLWHNGMFGRNRYQKKLYDWLIDYCISLER